VINFSFTKNTGPARRANIQLLGQNIPITQGIVAMPAALNGVQWLNSGTVQFNFTNIPNFAAGMVGFGSDRRTPPFCPVEDFYLLAGGFYAPSPIAA
jgi:hypothetical protein